MQYTTPETQVYRRYIDKILIHGVKYSVKRLKYTEIEGITEDIRYIGSYTGDLSSKVVIYGPKIPRICPFWTLIGPLIYIMIYNIYRYFGNMWSSGENILYRDTI